MMATFRGANPGAETIQLYSQRILRDIPEKFGLVDAIAAAESIADLERREGELAFPEVGTIIKACEIQRVARGHRDSAERSRMLVRWKCPDCGIYRNGFIGTDDNATRVCRGIPSEGNGACGGIMNEVHRERVA